MSLPARLCTIKSWYQNPYALLDRHIGQGEFSFFLRIPVVGRALVAGEPEQIAAIAKNSDLVAGRGTQALRPVVGERSLIVLEGAAHEAQRRRLIPAFFRPDPALEAFTAERARRCLAQLPASQPFSMMALAEEISLAVIVRHLFGDLSPERERLAMALVRRFMGSFRSPLVLFLRFLQRDLGPRSPWGRFVANRAALADFIHEEMHRPSAPEPGLVNEWLQEAAETRPADPDLVSEAIALLLFGHDSSAATLGWLFSHLCSHRESYAAVEAAVRAGADGEIAPLLTAALQESMRLRPVVVHLTRHAVADTQVGGHVIRAGERVLPCTYLAHHHPDYFPDPYRYRPERFLVGADYRHGYFPFGLGNRLCVGMPLALRQMEIIAVALLRQRRFRLADAEPPQAVRKMVIMAPAGGTRLRMDHG